MLRRWCLTAGIDGCGLWWSLVAEVGWSGLRLHWWEKPELKWAGLLFSLIFLVYAWWVYAISCSQKGGTHLLPVSLMVFFALPVILLMCLAGCPGYMQPLALILSSVWRFLLVRCHLLATTPIFSSHVAHVLMQNAYTLHLAVPWVLQNTSILLLVTPSLYIFELKAN